MRIKEIIDQLGNDIFGILSCEHCGHEQKFTGYADNYYFIQVVPSYYCKKCGKNRAGEVRDEV